MCQWGTDTLMEVTIPEHLSHSGKAYRKTVGIDSCIAPLVSLLNDHGYVTVASCCGHGLGPGRITLLGGRELLISPDMATTRQMLSVFDKAMVQGDEEYKPRKTATASRWARFRRLLSRGGV